MGMLFNKSGGSAGTQSEQQDKTGVTAQPLPPLPDLKTSPDGGSDAPVDPFQQTMLQIKPVHDGVNVINAAVQKIAMSGLIPGGGPLDQIIQLANSLLPLAAQSMLKPGGGGLGAALPPPSGAPPDLGAGAGGMVSPGPAPSGPGM